MTRRKIYLFFFLLTCLPASIHAQAGLSFRNISINEGLSQSSVVSIAVDNTGFLWFATQDGLNRYDGKEFVVFNKIFDDVTKPTGNQLGKVIKGNNNDLWLVTSGGKLERFNLYDQQFTPIDTLPLTGKPIPTVSCFFIDERGQWWIGTQNEGLYKYSPAQQRSLEHLGSGHSLSTLSGNHIHAIFRDKQKRTWLLTENGMTMFSHYSASPRKIAFQFDSALSSPVSFSTMDEDEESVLWAGSFGKGVFLKTEKDTTFLPFAGFSSSQTIPTDLVVQSIKTDQGGRIWVGTYGKGLYLINKKDRTIQNFTFDKKKSSSLGYNDVLCIEQDSRGGLWIGTDGGGLSYYHNALNNFATYSAVNLPDTVTIEQVRSITKDRQGMIWAGTSNQGLVIIDSNRAGFQQLRLPSHNQSLNAPGRIVSLLCDAQGDIWIGTQGNGLIILDAKSKKTKDWFYPGASSGKRLPDHTVWCMLPFKDNKILIGTQNAGLFLVDKSTGQTQDFNPYNRTSNNVRAITRIDDSTICIAYERTALKLMNTKTRSTKNLSDPALNKLWNEEIILKCVFYRAPFLFAGTLGKGLIIHDLSTGKQHWVTNAQGLPNNTIYGILEDKNGLLWISSNRGLCRLKLPANPAAINRSHFALFSAEDGLQSNEFNTGAYYAADDGTLFFGGVKGLNIFHPDRFVYTSQDIPVVITQATINNQPYKADTVISYKKGMRLRYSQNSMSFSFAALDYLSNARLNYSYRLLGYDDNWIDAGNRNYAAYTNLEPGNYVFEVRASDQTNSTNGSITRLAIYIAPPYWQTWWFITLVVMMVTFILYAFYRYRVNQLLQLQKVRSRIATDLHDDIGSTLTNINILSELSKKNIDHRKQAEIFLNRIAEEVNVTSQALDDIVWSINKNNDTVEETVARMRRYAAEMLEGANIRYSLQSDEQMSNRKLNMELRRDVYLLFKEAINNIYKHSKATTVEIRVWLDRNQLRMLIRDNGIGFDSKASTHRNGIKNMHERAGKWKGSIKLVTEEGRGTTTDIALPVS
jgi:ligand-binding sensor domain-containing protein/signal transduction histidine kinase